METPDNKTGIVAFSCDACPASTALPRDTELAWPWRRFGVVGMIGDFHACNDDHEQRIRRRYERPEQ